MNQRLKAQCSTCFRDVLLFSCLLGSAATAQGQSNEWAWIGGSSTIGSTFGQPGVYGGLGIPDKANVPGGRDGAASWTAKDGTLWLFGGNGFDASGTSGLLNDLWKYDPSTALWTWMGGSNTVDQPGTYPQTVGTSSNTAFPGARERATSWTDSSGNFWLFGGGVLEAGNMEGAMNDLWEYNPSSGQWTWMSGSSTTNQAGIYPAAPGTTANGVGPGARSSATGWVDQNGKLWLFGGSGFDSAGNPGDLNDLWEFDPATSQWTWVTGSSAFPVVPYLGIGAITGTYGDFQIPSTGNTPGGRDSANGWIDDSGNLWLFGGQGTQGIGFNVSILNLNDLWEFSPATGEWAWMGGSNSGLSLPNYGTLGIEGLANIPDVMTWPVGWKDKHNRFWLFGYVVLQPSGLGGYGGLSSMWDLDPATADWAWMGGRPQEFFSEPMTSGVYITQGQFSPGNTPGSRGLAATWTDLNGNLWLFGGSGIDTTGNDGEVNDLWEYVPSATTLPPAVTPAFDPPAGTYNGSQTITIENGMDNASFYYTTDGSAPTSQSTGYSGSIPVSSTVTLKAIAVANGYPASGIATATYTLLLPTFSVTGGGLTLAAGATTGNTATISVAPANGFTGTVTLAASVTSSPANAMYPPTLSFGSTNPVTISGTNPNTATLTITTTSPNTTAQNRESHPDNRWLSGGGAVLACILFFVAPSERKRWRTALGALALLIATGGSIGACAGGSSSSGIIGTTPGAYVITVNATSGTIQQSATVALTVQ